MAAANGQMVEFVSNNGSGAMASGYLSTPRNAAGPGLIVIQEWWGLVDHIKELADAFAEEGFTALAPDLYHGEATTNPDEAGRLMMALNIERSARDLGGAVKFLLDHDAVNSSKVGTVGFCMGGQLALATACQNPEVGACVDFYGIHPNVTLDFSGLQAPVLGFFGELDEFVTPDAARKLEHDIRSAGKDANFHVYPGVDHAFFNDSRPEAYNEEAATDAWNQVLGFFRDNL